MRGESDCADAVAPSGLPGAKPILSDHPGSVWRQIVAATRLVPALLLLAAALLAADARAEWPSDPNVNVPICTAPYGQQRPAIIPDGIGGAIIVWTDWRNATSWSIYAQRIDHTGSTQWTTNGVMLSEGAASQYAPSLVSDGAGGAIAVWQDSRSGTSHIYGQRISVDGTVQWDPAGVSMSTSSMGQIYPRLVSDGAGGVIVCWRDSPGVYAQRVSGAGELLWPARGVVISSSFSASSPQAIAPDGAGGAILAWGIDNSYVQRVNAAGVVQWATNGVAICAARGYRQFTGIVSDGRGGAIVSWAGGIPGSLIPFAQRVSANGTPLWTPNGVLLGAGYFQDEGPDIAADGTGGAVACWGDNVTAAWVRTQRVNAAGALQWSADGLVISLSGAENAVIVSDSTGGAIVAWARSGSIYAQRLSASGALLWKTSGLAICSAGTGSFPEVASDSLGSGIVVWQDARNGEDDLYAQRVDQWGYLGSGPPTATITATSGPGGAIAPSGAVKVILGTSQTFVFSPDPDFRVFDVLVDGTSVGPPPSYTFTNVQKNHTIEVRFVSVNVFWITASASPGGRVEPSGLLQVDPGGEQTFTFVPDPNGELLDVLVDGVSVGWKSAYTFTDVRANHTIHARFTVMTLAVPMAGNAWWFLFVVGGLALAGLAALARVPMNRRD
jgi:hypothetical protein